MRMRFLVCLLAVSWLFACAAWYDAAHGEDHWSDCKAAYEFCTRGGLFHRDCTVWTAHGKPLSVNRSRYITRNVNVGSSFCVENPWHMACGAKQELIHEHIDCPIPPELK